MWSLALSMTRWATTMRLPFKECPEELTFGNPRTAVTRLLISASLMVCRLAQLWARTASAWAAAMKTLRLALRAWFTPVHYGWAQLRRALHLLAAPPGFPIPFPAISLLL